MRAILVRLALILILGAGTAYAEPINGSVFGPSGAVSDLSVSGNSISFDLEFGVSGPIYLMVNGLDARQNYQAGANHSAPGNWTNSAVPSAFSTAADYDGFSFAQGSGLETGYLAAGGSGFNAYAAEPAQVGAGEPLMVFGLSEAGGGRRFLLRLDRSLQEPLEPLGTPEPGAMLLVGTGLVAIARAARKRRSQA